MRICRFCWSILHRKRGTFSQYWFDVGRASKTVPQYRTNISVVSRVPVYLSTHLDVCLSGSSVSLSHEQSYDCIICGSWSCSWKPSYGLIEPRHDTIKNSGSYVLASIQTDRLAASHSCTVCTQTK